MIDWGKLLGGGSASEVEQHVLYLIILAGVVQAPAGWSVPPRPPAPHVGAEVWRHVRLVAAAYGGATGHRLLRLAELWLGPEQQDDQGGGP